MQTTIYLHVGESKTGTSIIQNFLNVNRINLANRLGYLYPNFQSDSYENGRCHNHVEWYFDSINNGTGKFLKEMQSLLVFTKNKGITNVILSNESWLLNDKTTEIFQELIDQTPDVNVVIIAYLRRIDTWIESGWKQWGMKVYDNIEDYTEAPFVKSKFKRALDHLSDWETVIGKKNIIIRPYEKLQLKGGLIKDFLLQVGINYDDHTWNQTEDSNLAKNYGFNRDVLEILHTCRDLYASRHDNQLFDTFSELLSDKFQKKPFESYQLLSPKQRLDLIENNREFEAEIARQYMDRADGKIFHDPEPDPDAAWEPYEGLTIEKAIPILVEMIHEEHKKIRRMNQRLIQLSNQVQQLTNSEDSLPRKDQNRRRKKPLFKKLRDSFDQ